MRGAQPLPEGVWYFSFDRDKLLEVLDQLIPHSEVGGSGDFGDPIELARLFLDERTVILEMEFGLLITTNIEVGCKAELHLVVFDNKLSSHEEVVRDALIWLIVEFELQRLEIQLPHFTKAFHRFVEKKLGFTYEGRLRRRGRRGDDMFDLMIFSLLKDEVVRR